MKFDILTRARTGLILDNPFYGALALRMQLIEDNNVFLMSTNGTTIRYNPEALEKRSLEDVQFIMAHAIVHCMLAHHLRRNGRDPVKWNIATDFAVNSLLKGGGMKLPGDALYHENLVDFSADHIYDLLPDMPQSLEEMQQASSNAGEVDDSDNASDPAEADREESDWQVATLQAANAAKMMGKLPANMDRYISDLMDSKVDWRDILRTFVKSTCKEDYTWQRPNRRFIGQSMYLPSLYGETIGELVVAIDTSGSVTQEEMNQFASEVTAIMEDVSPTKVTVVYCDTRVAHTEVFTKDDLPLAMKPHGGGDTDFRPPFEWVEQQDITPVCFIYLTDMHCHRFPEEPDYPTLWISTSHIDSAPFGEVVKM